MAMPAPSRRWTRDEVLALPDDRMRYELVDGELLVTPSPRALHQLAVTALMQEIGPFVRTQGVGYLLSSPADLEIRPGELYQPDLFVVPTAAGRRPRLWADFLTPLLVVEISSLGTARYDRVIKRPAFQGAGVAEFWIVDIDARLVERWRPADARPEILIDRLVWTPPGATAGLELDLVAFFSTLLD